MILRETLENLMNFTYKAPKCDVHAHAVLSANQASVAASGWRLVNLDTEISDLGSDFNTSTHRFVCPVAGRYLVTGSAGMANFNAAGNYQFTGIGYNGNIAFASKAYIHAVADDPVVNAVGVRDCDISDYFELYVYHNSSASETIYDTNAYTYLTVTLLATD